MEARTARLAPAAVDTMQRDARAAAKEAGDGDGSVSAESIADVEVLADEPKSILLSLVAQLTVGMDLHKVTLPTFILEPRSMCERITDFMSHPHLVTAIPTLSDPVERFIGITRFFLSGWHIRPKGVKKPYNPVLGEFFRCTWTLPDKTTSYYVCEQVSHHPPMSAYVYVNPHHGIYITGDLRPKSRFLGNSAATLMQGSFRVRLAQVEEEYEITFPNVYARGILFGTMYMELGDVATIECAQTDLSLSIEFKTRGVFSARDLNCVEGTVHRGTRAVAHVSGKWTDEMAIEYYTVEEGVSPPGSLGSGKNSPSPTKPVGSMSTAMGKLGGMMANALPRLPSVKSSARVVERREVLFDANQADQAEICVKAIQPEAEMEEFESRRIWKNVTKGLAERNIDFATEHKAAIEENQRKICKLREECGMEWRPRFFIADGDSWRFDIEDLTKLDPDIAATNVRQRIYSRTGELMHKKFWESE